ncbi:MAG: hypothetical protein ACE5EG_12195 [Thermoanaerobaculia bacterium]
MSGRRRYLLFLVALVGPTGALLAVGYLPTRSLAGEAALPAMLLACAVSFVGSAVGGLPIATARESGLEGLKRFTASMVLRLLVVAVLAGAVIWFLDPERRPFLLWLAISYLVLLVADTGFAQAVFKRL